MDHPDCFAVLEVPNANLDFTMSRCEDSRQELVHHERTNFWNEAVLNAAASKLAHPSPENPDQPTAIPSAEMPPTRKGGRTVLNFWLDVALFVSVAFLGWVSTMLRFVFPAPTVADGWKVWGWTFDQWHDAQFAAVCICGLLIVEHIVLHWNWVCSVISTRILRVSRPDEASQAVYGVGTFIVLLMVMLGGIVAALCGVTRPAT